MRPCACGSSLAHGAAPNRGSCGGSARVERYSNPTVVHCKQAEGGQRVRQING
jgi:hypothetical protein